MNLSNKDFLKWHEIKSKLNEVNQKLYFHEREVWLCSLGLNVGFEQDGRGENFMRPVLIVKQYNLNIFWAVPLTTSDNKTGKLSKYYQKINFSSTQSVAIISQLRLLDKKRLIRKMGTISKSEFNLVKNKLKSLL